MWAIPVIPHGIYTCGSAGHEWCRPANAVGLDGLKDIGMTLRYTHLPSAHKQQAVRVLEFFAAKSLRFPHNREGRGLWCLVSILKDRRSRSSGG
jgi:hypothetical protein